MEEIRKNKYIRSGKPKEPTVFSRAWHRTRDQIRGDINFWFGFLQNNSVSDDLRLKIKGELRYLQFAELALGQWCDFAERNGAFIRNYYLEKK